MTEEIPKYLKGRMKTKDRSWIAKFRSGNETRGGQHWREEEERKCRVCWQKEETVDHILKECGTTKSEMEIEEFLGEEGKVLEVMKKIGRIREEAKEGKSMNRE